jgi:hypothetical protein
LAVASGLSAASEAENESVAPTPADAPTPVLFEEPASALFDVLDTSGPRESDARSAAEAAEEEPTPETDILSSPLKSVK